MSHTFRSRPSLALGVVAVLALAGCASDDATGAAESAAGGDDVEGDAAPEEDADDEVGSGTAVWMEEELEVESVSCSSGRPEPDRYQIRGSGDGFHVTAQGAMDLDASDGDDVVFASDEVAVEVFFQGDNGTIGDGEGYTTGRSDDDGSGLDFDAQHVRGTVELGPDMTSGASEVNPDGGTLELDLRC